jgi:hypothetical protein
MDFAEELALGLVVIPEQTRYSVMGKIQTLKREKE